MFKQYKQAIENWLRGIIRDEVAIAVPPINTSLEAERTAMANIFASVCEDVNASVDRLNELSHIGEATALRAHIHDLESQFVRVTDTLKKLHPTYKV